MLHAIVEGILELIFEIIFEVFLFYTGEIVLFLLTFGARMPRWNYYSDVSPTKYVVMTDFSVVIGLVFWCSLIVYISN
jgi:hypothetical protein